MSAIQTNTTTAAADNSEQFAGAGAVLAKGAFSPLRAEVNIQRCVVEGKLPSDLRGGFYAVGADPQFPLMPGNIPFDGEGHVRMFRFGNGRVDYRTRYAQTERYVAQDKAGRALMPMYRNPELDDPSVKGLSRSTANTHVINFKNMLLALKEDSPPTAMDLNTLETIDPVFTFDGQLPRDQPFTAHPKVCSRTGNILAFGYEAKGFGSDIIAMFEIDKNTGKKVWGAEIKVPYVSLVHDFAITENYVAFLIVPLSIDYAQMKRGGVHWSWDKDKKTYLGVTRRFGDGKDIKWLEGPSRCSTHTMGAFDDQGKLYWDLEISEGNPLVFLPNKDGSPPDFSKAASFIHRITVNMERAASTYEVEKLYPLFAPLPKQDDRYNTVAYRYGFFGCPNPNEPNPLAASPCYARVDHQTRTFKLWDSGPDTSLAEPCFAPKHATAREGEGYLLGVRYHLNQELRSDLVILDAEHVDAGPICTVQLPIQASPQVHGWWVREDQYPS